MSVIRAIGMGAMAIGIALGVMQHAGAQDYPSRPIRILVGFGPGGSTDIVARLLAQSLSDSLKQSVVVENRPGAGGRIAAEIVAKAPADGYTLLMGSAGLVVQLATGEKLGFDLQKDLSPIVKLAENPHVLVVSSSVPATSAKELIAFLKGKPDLATYASSGPNTSLHVAGALFSSVAGLNAVHVPYKGGAPALQDLASARVTMMFNDLQTIVPLVQSGALRPLAVTGKSRSPVLPNVPTMDELGLGAVMTQSWFGLMATGGTPPAVLEKLNTRSNEALRSAALRKRFEDLGISPVGGTPPEFAAFLKQDIDNWSNAVRLTGIRAE